VRMIGYQYYMVHHGSPVALFGHIYALESSPMSEEVVTSIERRMASPASMTALRAHQDQDPAHRLQLLRCIRQHLHRSELPIVRAAAVHTLSCLALLLTDISPKRSTRTSPPRLHASTR
jgi:hypothetical protein